MALCVDVAVFADVLEADADSLGNAGLLHGDAVESVGGGHGLFGVGDNHELCPLEKFVKDINEATNVCFVQWTVDFVQHAERTGPILKNGQQESYGG